MPWTMKCHPRARRSDSGATRTASKLPLQIFSRKARRRGVPSSLTEIYPSAPRETNSLGARDGASAQLGRSSYHSGRPGKTPAPSLWLHMSSQEQLATQLPGWVGGQIHQKFYFYSNVAIQAAAKLLFGKPEADHSLLDYSICCTGFWGVA